MVLNQTTLLARIITIVEIVAILNKAQATNP